MRRRLYVVLPDLASARQTANDLLLARVEDRHMHFLGNRDADLGELHEAGFWHKTDVRHAFIIGSGVGAVLGAVVGVLLKIGALDGIEFGVGTVILCTAIGLLFGGWTASLIGVSTPSVKLKAYEADFEAGRILLMVDVPHSRVSEIQQLLHRRHPEAVDHGIDLTMPAFP